MTQTTASRPDPRTIVTPDALSVAPGLLGLPLAGPWRRAAAILVDLLLVAILANARAVFFAFAFGIFVVWIALRRSGAGPSGDPVVALSSRARRIARFSFGCLGVLVLSTAALATWFAVTTDPDTELTAIDDGTGREIPVTLRGLRDFATIVGSEDSAAVAAATDRLVGSLLDEGFEPDEVRDFVADAEEPLAADRLAMVEAALAEQAGRRAAGEAGRSAESPATDVEPPAEVSLFEAYARARAEGDSARMVELGPSLGLELAADQIAEERSREGRRIDRLESENESLEARLDETVSDLQEERERGILATLFAIFDDVGLGLGWSGLYFTFFLSRGKGRTPGKRVMGVRVVRLDGRPISYWVAFERFGGYAASLFTGLEGFARILWDPNRQTLEDKLAETVVLRDTPEVREKLASLPPRGSPVATPAGVRSGAT